MRSVKWSGGRWKDFTTVATSAGYFTHTMAMRLLVKRNPAYPLAKLPTRGSAQSAGYDLYACEDATIPRGGRTVVQTGIHIALPEGHYGRVAPRSGLAVKHGIDVGAGVVDSDYRGLLGIVLFNFGTEDFQCMYG